MLESLMGNSLLSQYQSGFKPEGSTVKQLLSVTHDVYLKHLTLVWKSGQSFLIFQKFSIKCGKWFIKGQNKEKIIEVFFFFRENMNIKIE